MVSAFDSLEGTWPLKTKDGEGFVKRHAGHAVDHGTILDMYQLDVKSKSPVLCIQNARVEGTRVSE